MSPIGGRRASEVARRGFASRRQRRFLVSALIWNLAGRDVGARLRCFALKSPRETFTRGRAVHARVRTAWRRLHAGRGGLRGPPGGFPPHIARATCATQGCRALESPFRPCPPWRLAVCFGSAKSMWRPTQWVWASPEPLYALATRGKKNCLLSRWAAGTRAHAPAPLPFWWGPVPRPSVWVIFLSLVRAWPWGAVDRARETALWIYGAQRY